MVVSQITRVAPKIPWHQIEWIIAGMQAEDILSGISMLGPTSTE